jgi:alkylation response protein AidB-like acyl-CoA dehydrogenase
MSCDCRVTLTCRGRAPDQLCATVDAHRSGLREDLPMSDLLQRVRALQPMIRTLEDEIIATRRLPSALVDALRATGVFRMAMPASRGGLELPYLEQLEVLEALAHANGSVGWCAMIGCDGGYYSAWFDEEIGSRLFPLNGIVAGFPSPAGLATEVDDGYRVTGSWKFGSGVSHADVIVGGAFLADADGALQPSAADQSVLWRTFVLPRASVEIKNTWYATGLEGSGSEDYSVSDVFVARDEGMYLLGPPKRRGRLWTFLNTIAKVAIVPLGIARRTIDDVIAIAPNKLAMPGFRIVREEVRTHDAVAHAEAVVSAARAFLWEAVGDALAVDSPSLDQRVRVRLAMQYAAAASRDAIASLYDTMTTSSVYRPNAIDQALRDTMTINQHVLLSSRNRIAAGRVLLGLDCQDPTF